VKRHSMQSENVARTGLAVLLTAVVGASCTSPSRDRPDEVDSAAATWIGITATINDQSAAAPLAYAQAVRDAGGLPVILPPIDDDALRAEYVQKLDGLVLTGGADVPPSAYGEKPHPATRVMPEARWRCESKLIDAWLKTGKPVLGICLGLQMTNVVRGGSLVQDLPSEVGGKVVHGNPSPKKDNDNPITHRVTLAPDSRLREIFGEETITVVSSHHQAAKRVGRGLRVAARSDDEVIEALELSEHPWAVFVQWHPERMDRAHRQVLFVALFRACHEAERHRQGSENRDGLPDIAEGAIRNH